MDEFDSEKYYYQLVDDYGRVRLEEVERIQKQLEILNSFFAGDVNFSLSGELIPITPEYRSLYRMSGLSIYAMARDILHDISTEKLKRGTKIDG